jgi:nucleotide-binding universal stress UspA family protein
MTASTSISQQPWTPTNELGDAVGPHGSHRVLVVTDGSGTAAGADTATDADAATGADAGRAAFAVAREWTVAFGTDVCAMEVSEQRDRRQPRGHTGAAGDLRLADATAAPARRVEVHGWTLGGRTRHLASEIAAAAEACGADVIVLGVNRRRLARRHLTPSLRDQLTSATALPVLVTPSTTPAR